MWQLDSVSLAKIHKKMNYSFVCIIIYLLFSYIFSLKTCFILNHKIQTVLTLTSRDVVLKHDLTLQFKPKSLNNIPLIIRKHLLIENVKPYVIYIVLPWDKAVVYSRRIYF